MFLTNELKKDVKGRRSEEDLSKGFNPKELNTRKSVIQLTAGWGIIIEPFMLPELKLDSTILSLGGQERFPNGRLSNESRARSHLRFERRSR